MHARRGRRRGRVSHSNVGMNATLIHGGRRAQRPVQEAHNHLAQDCADIKRRQVRVQHPRKCGSSLGEHVVVQRYFPAKTMSDDHIGRTWQGKGEIVQITRAGMHAMLRACQSARLIVARAPSQEIARFTMATLIDE